jgi:hypothetical protein
VGGFLNSNSLPKKTKDGKEINKEKEKESRGKGGLINTFFHFFFFLRKHLTLPYELYLKYIEI